MSPSHLLWQGSHKNDEAIKVIGSIGLNSIFLYKTKKIYSEPFKPVSTVFHFYSNWDLMTLIEVSVNREYVETESACQPEIEPVGSGQK